MAAWLFWRVCWSYPSSQYWTAVPMPCCWSVWDSLMSPVVDLSIPYGAASLDADVTRMQQNGVDFVATCMDTTGDIKLSQTLQQHGMGTAVQYWLDGYDQQTLQNN